jgi:hypothetical protein
MERTALGCHAIEELPSSSHHKDYQLLKHPAAGITGSWSILVLAHVHVCRHSVISCSIVQDGQLDILDRQAGRA